MTTERAELLTSIYNRYSQALRSTEHLSLDVVQFALTLAIQDVAAALEIISKQTQPTVSPELANARLEQLNRINEWIRTSAGDAYDDTTDDGDTADAMIAVADTLRGQVAKLRTELAAAIDERNHLDGELRASQKMMNSAHDEAKANAKDAHELRQQLAQLDADNAALIQRNTALAADLATARSYFINRQPTNGHDITDDFGAVITNPPVLPIPSAQPAIHLTWPDDLADWVEGLYKGRHDWRKLPRKTRWQLIANVVRQIPPSESSPTNWFDAHRPIWMSTARAAVLTFGSGSWESIATLVRNDEVPA